MENKALSIFIK